MSRRTILVVGFLLGALLASPASAAVVNVSDAIGLRNAIDAAAPGDVITLAPGTYDFSSRLFCDVAGTALEPIVVRAENPGDALLRLDSPFVLFQVSEPHWRFEHLEIEGICAQDADCEHAIQLIGDADFTEIRAGTIRDFNIPIKSNGSGGAYPDDVLIESMELRSSSARATASPVAMVDALGGRRWILRDNVLADFGKSGGNTLSYAAILRGNSRDGLIERNLVICEDAHTEGVRLGLSLGGGGSAPDVICEEGTCTPEHQNGVIRNNLILDCPDDAGIYLNEADGAGVYNNTHIGSTTSGIVARFAASDVTIRNNLTSGPIVALDTATITQGTNLASVPLSSFSSWFTDPDALDFSLQDGSQLVDQGIVLADVPDDFCTNARDDGSPDIGAVEYDAQLGSCGPIVVFRLSVPTLQGWSWLLLGSLVIASVFFVERARSLRR